jgi:hypothetical protein
MGLDMYLYAKKYVANNDYYQKNPEIFDEVLESLELTPDELDSEMLSMTISIPVMYWRKQNAIHNWFVLNAQGGEDNCKEYWVSREQMKELKEICEQVKQDPRKASELLPTADGFFFGGTDYDDWYLNGIDRTVIALDRYLKSPNFKDFDFYYQSSW